MGQSSEEACGARHPLQFAQVYTEHFDFVWRCLRSLGVSHALLDDAAQEVFVVVHRRLAEFRHDSSLRTWLYGIVRNVSANQRRGERRKGGLTPLEESSAPSRENPLEDAQDAEAARFVAQFMAALDEKKRELFALVMLEEFSVPEVAQLLGIPLNTAYTRLRSVRLAFQDALKTRGSKTP